MPDANAASSHREDARALQAKLYREIGISAVAAALRFTTQPDPSLRQRGLDKPLEKTHLGHTRAA